MAARYIVKVNQFKCVDESGADFFGSDEPYWAFTSKVSSETHTTRSKVFGDVDSGDTRKFAEDAVVWPQKGADKGAEDPIGLTIQLWDQRRIRTETYGCRRKPSRFPNQPHLQRNPLYLI